MKKTVISVLIALVIVPSLHAADKEDALWGALVGGALGVLVGENSSDIRTEYAVPAMAAVGALVGYAHDRDYHGRSYYDGWHRNRYWDDHRYSRHSRVHSPWHYRRFDDRHYRVSYPYWPQRVPRYRPVRVSSTPPQTAPRPSPQSQITPTDYQPGVTLIRVPLKWPNGMIRNVRILKIGDRYVGPQGEPYPSLPDAETLGKRYLPSSS